MIFPFEREKSYTFKELELYERYLLSTRQGDPELSKEWRKSSKRTKIRNEEVIPLLYLKRRKQWSDNDMFCLMPQDNQHEKGIDIQATISGKIMNFQITVADPRGESGNSEHHKMIDELNKTGFSGCNTDSEDLDEEPYDDCLKGLHYALKKKANHGAKDIDLLIYARAYNEELSLPKFQSIIEAAMRDYKDKMRFKNIYIVTPDPDCYYEISMGI